MRDREAIRLAGEQYNRVSRRQLNAAGLSDAAIAHRLEAKRLVIVEPGVFAFAPVLDDPWSRWMGATLTDDDTYLSHVSGACAYGALDRERRLVTVTRPGAGGPRRHGGLIVYRRPTLPGEVGVLRGVPITCPERTLLDLAATVSPRTLARGLREMLRLEHTSLAALVEWLEPRRRRRGIRPLLLAASRYAGLPIDRARSASEVQAMLVLRHAGRRIPQLNVAVAGIEADLVWRHRRLIIEIDGGPFHLDVGEDARKQAIWEAAGWTVLRIDADDVFDHPERLLALAPEH